jgi:hypothetical protein
VTKKGTDPFSFDLALAGDRNLLWTTLALAMHCCQLRHYRPKRNRHSWDFLPYRQTQRGTGPKKGQALFDMPTDTVVLDRMNRMDRMKNEEISKNEEIEQ